MTVKLGAADGACAHIPPYACRRVHRRRNGEPPVVCAVRRRWVDTRAGHEQLRMEHTTVGADHATKARSACMPALAALASTARERAREGEGGTWQ
eukprot:scaffold6552_cov26-Tisochrysis_lutea.AAC.2